MVTFVGIASTRPSQMAGRVYVLCEFERDGVPFGHELKLEEGSDYEAQAETWAEAETAAEAALNQEG